jgi:hypothetical protein
MVTFHQSRYISVLTTRFYIGNTFSRMSERQHQPHRARLKAPLFRVAIVHGRSAQTQSVPTRRGSAKSMGEALAADQGRKSSSPVLDMTDLAIDLSRHVLGQVRSFPRGHVSAYADAASVLHEAQHASCDAFGSTTKTWATRVRLLPSRSQLLASCGSACCPSDTPHTRPSIDCDDQRHARQQ